MSLVVTQLRVSEVKHSVSKSFDIKCYIFNLKETSPALALQLEPTYSCPALGLRVSEIQSDSPEEDLMFTE